MYSNSFLFVHKAHEQPNVTIHMAFSICMMCPQTRARSHKPIRRALSDAVEYHHQQPPQKTRTPPPFVSSSPMATPESSVGKRIPQLEKIKKIEDMVKGIEQSYLDIIDQDEDDIPDPQSKRYGARGVCRSGAAEERGFKICVELCVWSWPVTVVLCVEVILFSYYHLLSYGSKSSMESLCWYLYLVGIFVDLESMIAWGCYGGIDSIVCFSTKLGGTKSPMQQLLKRQNLPVMMIYSMRFSDNLFYGSLIMLQVDCPSGILGFNIQMQ
ncbi:hypothetical protein Tco_0117969 [Tanacetum coccineum]